MSKHSPEPWSSDINSSDWHQIRSSDKNWIADTCASMCDGNIPLGEANAARIVACVNACAGMEDPAVEIEKLKRQRDELLNLVKQARLEWLDQNQTSDDTDVVTPYDHVLYRGIADES